MRKKVKKLLKKTKGQVETLRNKVNKLKDSKPKPPPISDKPKSKKEPEHVVVEFSLISVAKATLVVIALYLTVKFFGEIRNVVVIVFVSMFLAAALDSIVDRCETRKIPRGVSVIGIYIIAITILTFFISTLIPLVATQTLELAKTVTDLVANLTKEGFIWNLPYAENLQEALKGFIENADQQTIISNVQAGLEQIGSQLQHLAGNTVGVVKVLFNGIFNAILVLVLTFFIIVDEKGINHFFTSLFPSRHTKYIIAKSDAVKEKIGYWLRGQITMMFGMTLITFIGLKILGIEYALTLAILAGFTELLPVVGPVIAAVPALLIGLNESPMTALWVLILYIIIQQLEGNIMVPMVMKKAVDLSPIIIIIAMLIGFQFLGILGVIISVPVAAAVSIFIKDYTSKTK
jgi:predicted PurR-regulated permease PerM